VRNDKRRKWNGFTFALILTFSPGEKEQLLFVSVLLADCPANPVARIFKETAGVRTDVKPAGMREIVILFWELK